jgi:hypothetical protein
VRAQIDEPDEFAADMLPIIDSIGASGVSSLAGTPRP